MKTFLQTRVKIVTEEKIGRSLVSTLFLYRKERKFFLSFSQEDKEVCVVNVTEEGRQQ